MFVIENGSGLVNSNSYVSYEELLDYCSLRIGFDHISGDSGYQIDEEEARKYLVSASDMMDRLKWVGRKARYNQSMKWPRKFAYNKCDDCVSCLPCDIVPREIKEATIILTSLLISGKINSMNQESSPLVKSMSFDGQKIEFVKGGRLRSSDSDDCGGMATVEGDDFKNVRHLTDCFMERRRGQVRLKRG
jgi:hypothetical protein